jgi:hypothetical protein
MNESNAYTYWLIQYRDSPPRQEPRNIGVLVHRRRAVACLMLGETGTGIDVRPFCILAGLAESAGWLYREWVHWFKVLAEDVDGSLERLQTELDRLDSRQGRFLAGEPATTFAPEPVAADVMAATLFGEMVSVPQVTVPPVAEFEQRIQEVLEEAELDRLPQFHRDVELELPDRPTFIRFDAFLEGPKAIGIKLLRLERARDGQASRQVNDILHTFETAVTHGLLHRECCAVIHDRPSPTRRMYLERVAAGAVLLPAFSADTPAALRRLAVP